MADEFSLKAQGLWDYANNRPLGVADAPNKSDTGIHPAPTEFSQAQLAENPILQFFHYRHLPPKLQVTSYEFFALAQKIINTLPRNAERTVALRKLLEAKDAAVRATLPGPNIARGISTGPELGEPREIGGHDDDRDGPISFND